MSTQGTQDILAALTLYICPLVANGVPDALISISLGEAAEESARGQQGAARLAAMQIAAAPGQHSARANGGGKDAAIAVASD